MKTLLQRHRVFIGILIIAAVVRFWALGSVPANVDWDEAALGYNAYSILKTGRDEYGTKFPLVMRSFDDYKPPLYVYLTIPSVALFGLHPWSVRLPAAVSGVLAVAGAYVLVAELLRLGGGLKKSSPAFTAWPAVSALLLALSPWHIQFSRIAFEAGIGVTINIWAAAMFLAGMRDNRRLWFSAFLFGLGLYAYHSERIFLPLLVLALLVACRTECVKKYKALLVFVIIGLFTVAPLIPVTFTKTSLTRLQGTSALADQTGLLRRSVAKLQYDNEHGYFWGVAFDNRRLEWAKTLAGGYLSHYSLRWLFVSGDNPRHHAPDMGLLYLWELPFLLWGMFAVARGGGRRAGILFTWFFIAPVAASPTTELPHAIRTLVFLPVFQMFTAYGLIQSLQWLKGQKRMTKTVLSAVVVAGVMFNVFYYFHMYFGHMDREYSQYWQYGYRQAVAYAEEHKDRYQKIVVSTKLEQPHMFFLFYTQYDPAKYLAGGGTVSGGFAEAHNAFDIYEFRPIDWQREKRDGSVLYIGTPAEIGGSPLMTIRYLDGKEAMRIASR